MKVTIVSVPNCANCPFSFDPDPLGAAPSEEPWTCTAAEDDSGYREIHRLQKRPGGPWLPPPKWCPLRKSAHVIQLETP